MNEGDVIRIYASGRGVLYTANKTGLTEAGVKRVLRENGVELRKKNSLLRSISVGMKFGKLTILDIFKGEVSGSKCSACKCACDCGNEIVVKISDILRGNNVSCGCRQIGPESPLWKGCGDISGSTFDQIKGSALSRRDGKKREFSVTIQELWNLFVEQNGKCALSGVSIYFAKNSREKQQGLYTASLDRADSSRGYTIDNVQWVHKDVNNIKTDMDQGRFVELCGLISDHIRKRDILMEVD
jgi:hypothetical protein